MKARTTVLVVTALAGFAAARRLFARTRLPYLGAFQRELARSLGEVEAARVASRAQARYDELCSQRPQVASHALRLHLERSLLPGLAFYQALLAEREDRQAALEEMERLMASVTAWLHPLMSALRVLPNSFAVFRRIERWVVRLGFPSGGWEMEQVEDNEDCVAFNVRRCFYLDTLTSYGSPELTSIYCAGDDILFEELAPSITWERTKTLGRGHEQCNFRWCRSTKTAPLDR